MKSVKIVITSASYSGNKGAAAMLQSSIQQLYNIYGKQLQVNLISSYPDEDKNQIPWSFMKLIPAKPKHLALVDFPSAILFHIFKNHKSIRKILLRNQVVNSYHNCDMVIDESGISFADEQGAMMNTYAFIRMAIPILIGKPVIKYSQALGSFNNFYNRLLAKIILPKLDLICARGQITYRHLSSIGVTKNVKICADGAFSMGDSVYWKQYVEKKCSEDKFFDSTIVGISISSVVEKKCEGIGIDYCAVINEFITYLNKSGYSVLLIANAARINSSKTSNNDLWTGDRIFSLVKNKNAVRWYHKEMAAEEIREYIGKCEDLVASRFHAMIGALERKVPVFLIGWSHKYQEVLDMFELGQYAADYSELTVDELIEGFEKMKADNGNIIELLNKHHEEVVKSSKMNICLISKRIDKIIQEKEII